MKNPETFKYYAFISYKSEDVEWVMWLQHELEHYHLPAAYNGRTDIARELRPVFRDLDELSAGNLPEQIQQALRDSINLIVICSPQAAKSKWVNSEVETFISLGRTRNIFPFIVDGDSPSDFYPSSLLNLPQKEERLGGDVRISGRDAAFVKVVAGMLGLPFDSLWKRYEKEKAEEERKQREDRDRLYKIQSSYLAEKALELQNLGCSYLPVRLSIEALPNNLSNPHRPYTPIAERVLRFLTCTQQSYLLRHDIREDVCSIAYNAKKKFLASASESIIKIWAIETGQLIYERYFDRKIIGIAFNSDGNKVTAASIGNHWSEVCIYELNIEKMECITLCEGNENCGLVVKKIIEEDGIVLSHFPNTNILWELFHDQLLKNDITIIANKADSYSSMIYCHATKYLVLSQNKRISVYDRITLSLKYSICVEDHSLVKVDDKEEFLILSYNNMINVYCLKDGRFLFNHNSQDESVNEISCNKYSSSITYVTDKGVYNWNYINGDCCNYYCCDNISQINCLELLNKDSLICINEKNNIRFINMGYKLSISKIDNNISKLAFSNDGRIVAYSCENGPLFIRYYCCPLNHKQSCPTS